MHGHKRGLTFSVDAADHYFEFCEAYCTVLSVTDADVEEFGPVKPFILEPSQAFIGGSVFGWRKADGRRRFKYAYIETGKGSGKSPLAGSIGLYMMTSDGEARAEVYAAASKKDQAMILFKDAVDMVQGSPELNSRIVPSGVRPVYRLSHPRTGSVFKPISADDGQSGPRPSCALVDEFHEHKDGYVIRMLVAGFKFRRQPLLFIITNSGFDKQSVCYEYHERAAKACLNDDDFDDELFAYVCALDEEDDPFEDESCWIKANPTLGATITVEYLRSQVAEARRLPSTRNTCLRLNFCRWTDAESVWMTREVWTKAEIPDDEDVRIEDFAGADCYLATDLSYDEDLTAVAAAFPEGRDLYLFVDYWTPRETIYQRADKDRVPYPQWAAIDAFEDEPRYMFATPGNVVPMAAVAERLGWYDRTFNVCGYAYDKYRHPELERQLEDLGQARLVAKMIEHPQGFRRGGLLYDKRGRPIRDEKGVHMPNPLWMPGSLDALTKTILAAATTEDDGQRIRLRAAVNPVLRWNVSAAVVRQDPAGTGGEVFTKLKVTGRIDGLVAGAMAVGLALAPPVRRKSLGGMLAKPVVVK